MGNYEKTDSKFVNPYHFVPLDKDPPRREFKVDSLRDPGRLTGWFDCELTTKTPLFIPNTNDSNFFKSETVGMKSYDFFSYDSPQDGKPDEKSPTKCPVIPGSSIRGAIRTAFEAATNSCLSTIDDKRALYRRVTSGGAKPGRIVREQDKAFKIIPCKRYGIKITDNLRDKPDPRTHKICYNASESVILNPNEFEDGEEVYIEVGQAYPRINKRNGTKMTLFHEVKKISKKQDDKCKVKGYIHLGEPFGDTDRKHHESVFVEEQNVKALRLEERDLKNLLDNFCLYQDETVNQNLKGGNARHNGYQSNLLNAKDVNSLEFLHGKLVYYSQVPDHDKIPSEIRTYLCPAAIGREVFHNRLADLVGSHAPCKCLESLCPACALFGLVGADGKEGGALASRVRFSDARISDSAQEAEFKKPLVLPELASPKISASEMYLVKPENEESRIWNYDYLVRPNKKPILYKARIQGRKFYWHHEDLQESTGEKSDRQVMVRPLEKGNRFAFRVHFDGLSELEMKRLHWVLTLGGSKDHGHKIGMGKPVGLGSVQIEVQATNLRKVELTDDDLTYEIQVIEYLVSSDIKMGTSDHVLDALKRITNLSHIEKNISYPYCVASSGEKIPEHYEWFVGNRQIANEANAMLPKFESNLRPLTPRSEITLPVYKKYPPGHRDTRNKGSKETSNTSTKPATNSIPRSEQRGQVKFFSDDKGFGFLIPEGGGGDIFVRKSNVQGSSPLQKGDSVCYYVRQGNKGLEAYDVRRDT